MSRLPTIPTHDRHGIVTRRRGADESEPLPCRRDLPICSQHRPRWRADAAVGKTLVSSSMIDRVAGKLGRRLVEVPVGFKWFVDGPPRRLARLRRRGERRRLVPAADGTVWTTDKDGIILGLLAAEITARTGHDPGSIYRDLTRRVRRAGLRAHRCAGDAGAEERCSQTLSPEQVAMRRELAGEPIVQMLTAAPGNGEPHRRPQGRRRRTAGSPRGRRAPKTSTRSTPRAFAAQAHLRRIQEEARRHRAGIQGLEAFSSEGPIPERSLGRAAAACADVKAIYERCPEEPCVVRTACTAGSSVRIRVAAVRDRILMDTAALRASQGPCSGPARPRDDVLHHQSGAA